MKTDEANEIRLVADVIMRRLYVAGEVDQLKILRMYADRAIEEIYNERAKAAAEKEG